VSSDVNADFGENVSKAVIVPVVTNLLGSGFTACTSGGCRIAADIAGYFPSADL